MALARDTFYQERTDTKLGPVVQSGAVIYGGALLALGHPTHATSGKRGVAYAFNDEAGAIPLGFADQPLTGDGTLRASIEAGSRIRRVAVTGASSAAASNGKWVFATDDGTFTLTKTVPNLPVGIIVDWVVSTTAWVYFLSFGELLAIQAAGGIHRQVLLGVGSAGAATGNMATGIVAPCHGLITEVYGIVIVEPTDADVSQAINLEIGGVDVTGGVVTVAFNSAVGTKLAGTAVTAANEFREGDLIDIETVTNPAGTTADPGLTAIYVGYDIQPGL